LNADGQVCVRFRLDAFICSFDQDGLYEQAGPNGIVYLEKLRQRQAKFPDGYVHVWQGGKIIGQMEMQIVEEPPIGYVNLFYLVPEMRSSVVAHALHAYAMAFCAGQHVQPARLSVSPTNQRAISFYQIHGWCDMGPRPEKEEVNLMECVVPELLDDN